MILIALYVDDILILSNSQPLLKVANGGLMAHWAIQDLGEVDQFLGIRIERDRAQRMMHISQRQLLMDILGEAGMSECNPSRSPFCSSG